MQTNQNIPLIVDFIYAAPLVDQKDKTEPVPPLDIFCEFDGVSKQLKGLKSQAALQDVEVQLKLFHGTRENYIIAI